MSLGRRGTPSERELAAFADGSLPASERGRIERELSGSPDLRAAVAAQQRVLGAIDAASRERAPSSLRARVWLVQPPVRPRRAGLGVTMASSAIAACAAVVVAIVLLAGGGTVAPTVAQAAVLTDRSPQAGVIEPLVDHGMLPKVRAAGLTFPYWEDRFGFKALGVRYDMLGGRRVTTVFYHRGLSRVAYEIVWGPPLRLGSKVWTMTRSGVKLWAIQTATAWCRDGSATDTPAS